MLLTQQNKCISDSKDCKMTSTFCVVCAQLVFTALIGIWSDHQHGVSSLMVRALDFTAEDLDFFYPLPVHGDCNLGQGSSHYVFHTVL